MNRRLLALVAGLLALALGVAVAVSPGLLGLDFDRALVTALGVVTLALAVRQVTRRRGVDFDEAVTPDPEYRVPTPPPGEDLRDSLGGFFTAGRLPYNQAVRGLRAAAVEVLVQYEGLSEAEAERRVDAGTWTDDGYAAAYLGGEDAPDPPSPGLLRRVVAGGVPKHRKVRHAVSAIADRAGLEPRPDGDADAFPQEPPETFSASAFSVTSERPARTADGGSAAERDGNDTGREPEGDPGTAAVVRAARPTNRWRGIGAVALVGIGAGVLTAEPAALLAGAAGIGFAAYARAAPLAPGLSAGAGDDPTPSDGSAEEGTGDDGLVIDRSLDPAEPDPGETVVVTVTVTNEHDRPVPDLRVVDSVPEALRVTGGSPRHGTALRAGEAATFEYEMRAGRGTHTFGPAAVIAKDLPGSVEETRLVGPETTVTCRPTLRATTEPVPLRQQAARFAGRVETDTAGAGLEFYATREYRPGDALSRVDWNRRARTGELSTVEFRSEQAATVMVVVDARDPSYAAPEPETLHALDRGVEAAGRLYGSLTATGNQVGIAAFPSATCWLAPGTGEEHERRVREMLATHPDLSPVPRGDAMTVAAGRSRLRRRLSAGTQVVFVSPLCDRRGADLARWLDEYGYPVTVLSPDPTADRTAGHRLARVARGLRLRELRGRGIPVVDWAAGEPVDVALARSNRREGP
ncbi:MAG: DUF58 domain-containing protein [Haloarculaceae archaeon]